MQLRDLEYRKYELGETLGAEEEAQLRDLQSKEKLAELEKQTQIALQNDRIQADKELQQLADDAAAQRQQVEVDAEKFIKELELTQELEIEYMEDIRLTGQQFLADYAKILVSPDFESGADRHEALQSLTNQYEAELNLLASLAEGEVIQVGDGVDAGGNTDFGPGEYNTEPAISNESGNYWQSPLSRKYWVSES
jgi:hypothetical protein